MPHNYLFTCICFTTHISQISRLFVHHSSPLHTTRPYNPAIYAVNVIPLVVNADVPLLWFPQTFVAVGRVSNVKSRSKLWACVEGNKEKKRRDPKKKNSQSQKKKRSHHQNPTTLKIQPNKTYLKQSFCRVLFHNTVRVLRSRHIALPTCSSTARIGTAGLLC